MNGLRIIKAENMAPGMIAALRGSRVVWIGKLGDPIEDIDADGLLLSPTDYEQIANGNDSLIPAMRSGATIRPENH